MKIAVATDNGLISGHFGKCEQFTVFDIEEKKISGRRILDTSEHGHGLLPAFLAKNGVDTVIAGGMGDGARQNLNSLGMTIISGASGNAEEAVQKYLAGTLMITEGGCNSHHDGGHKCNCHGH